MDTIRSLFRARSLRGRPLHLEGLEDRRMLAGWPAYAGGAQDERTWAVAALPDGASIITGDFLGTAVFGDTTITAVGSRDIFIAKVNPNGSFAWAKRAGGSGADSGYDVCALSDGSALVTGTVVGTTFVDGMTILSSGGYDVFVAKVNADGSVAWVTTAGGTSLDTGNNIAALPDGSAIVSGNLNGSATFGSTTLAGGTNDDMFVAKVSADGAFVWAKKVAAANSAYDMDLSTLPDGSSLVAGYFSGTATFGATALTSAGQSDGFVARFQADGTVAWAVKVGGATVDGAYGVAALADGSAFVTGGYNGSVMFGNTTLTTGGFLNAFIGKLNADGSFAWVRQGAGSTSVRGADIVATADGSAVATGIYFGGSATFGSTVLANNGNYDLFITKLSGSGDVMWATRGGGTDAESVRGISLGPNGAAIVAGWFSGTTDFGGITRTSSGGTDVFVAKVDANGVYPQAPTDIGLSATSVAENVAVGTIVGAISTTDQNAGDTFTHTIVSGDASVFVIEGSNLKTAGWMNHEVAATRSIRIRSTDSTGLWVEKDFTITITDIGDESLVAESIVGPASGAYATAAVLNFTLTLSEVVVVKGVPKIRIRIGTASRVATYVGGSGTAQLTFQYKLRRGDAGSQAAVGTTLVLPRKDAIVAGSESLVAALPVGVAGAVAAGVQVDTRAPTVVGPLQVPVAGTYAIGQPLDFVVTFSEAVSAAPPARIAVTIGTAKRFADYSSGSGTTSLTFRYVVQDGDATPASRGISVGRAILIGTGGSVRDLAGNTASLRIRVPSTQAVQVNA